MVNGISVAFFKKTCFSLVFSLWKPHSVDNLRVLARFKAFPCALFTALTKLLIWSQSWNKNFRFINQGHVKGEYRFWKRACCMTQWLRSAAAWAMSADFCELEKLHVSQRKGGASESYCRRERHNGQRTQRMGRRNTSICVSHNASPLYPSQGEYRDSGCWMSCFHEKNGADFSQMDWKREYIISLLNGSGQC